MNKFQQAISIILESPVSSDEKVALIGQINSALTEEDLNKIIAAAATYMDATALKNDEVVKIYDKYDPTIKEMEAELEALQQKPISEFQLSANDTVAEAPNSALNTAAAAAAPLQ